MKIKDEFLNLPKELLYETYLKIVYNPEEYDKITRSKMIEEIIKEYKPDYDNNTISLNLYKCLTTILKKRHDIRYVLFIVNFGKSW